MSTVGKIAMIGGGGKNIGGTILQIIDAGRLRNIEFALYGGQKHKIARNIALAQRISNWNGCRITVHETPESVLDGADIVLYCATAGYRSYDGFDSFGIAQGAHILYIASLMQKKCKNAWLFGATNPPEIPLSACVKRFGMVKSIGLCNAPLIVQNSLAALTGTDPQSVRMLGTGVNHDVWYDEVIVDSNESKHDLITILKKGLADPNKRDHPFFQKYPEWFVAMNNNLDIWETTGYLVSPAGGTKRMKGLPIKSEQIAKILKRPSNDDFDKAAKSEMSNEEMMFCTSRCGGGVPGYTASLIESVFLEDEKIHSALVHNNQAFKEAPNDIHIQADISWSGKEMIKHDTKRALPAYVKAILTARFIQNDFLSDALAFQDDKAMRMAMLCMPETVAWEQAKSFDKKMQKTVEPVIPFN